MTGRARPSRRGQDLLADYHPAPGVADELMTPTGTLRPGWAPLIDHLSRLSRADTARHFARGDQYLRDTGVFFRQQTGLGSTERDWPLSHVPVLIHEREWAGVEAAIVQRADLLERVMADLYGPGRLVSDGLLPPQLVAGNPEWLRPLVGVQPRSGHFLHFLAFEIGRSPDGSWFVLGDRTQVPSGAGFALENRVATSRVLADLYPLANVKRLAGFFRAFREALNDLRGSPDARVGILTPGPHTDTYYEHAYIARYLGFMLLESEDLRVQDGQVMVRTITGPEPVGVLWRRLDAAWADPLELMESSALGTPGMVSALRAGGLTMANALGSGVLETRAFLAFLPRICRVLTGAPLLMPNIATWWCGQPRELAHVTANAGRMLIGPALSMRLPFQVEDGAALAGTMMGTDHASVAELLAAEGPNLVGQEAVTLSTTPAMVDGRLLPRPMTVRVFAARTAQGWVVMPGGYARIGRSNDATALAMQAGGTVADVWVVGDQPVAPETLGAAPGAPFERKRPGVLPSRAADNLFWMGRYVERAEGTLRDLRAYHLRLAEAGDTDLPLPLHIAAHLDRFGIDPETAAVPPELLWVIDAANTCAGKVRDRFSIDGLLALRDLASTARRMASTAVPGDDAARAMSVLLRKTAGFTGLVHENMYRFAGWRFLSLGRALERASRMCAVLAHFAEDAAPEGSFDIAVEVGDSRMAHKRQFSVDTSRNTVIDLLALDPQNPRSILFQMEEIRNQVSMLPLVGVSGKMSDLGRAVLTIHTGLAVSTPETLDARQLRAMRDALAGLSESLTHTYLG
ncbi:circularly permuted type 2 ATP-grasp protein [Paracoccaceae bacterium Fryx2]|nr:circularly permuted type 2 ATP-grasp protein [Paracoccaceae bacterium Fryx2]